MSWILALPFIAGAFTSSALAVSGTWLVWRKIHRRRKASPRRQPTVTILKPLCGLEERLEENLRSFFRLSYPSYEIIFSVQQNDSIVRELADRLCREHPFSRARVVVTDTSIGPNPKINNLVEAYGCARGDVIVISDSNVFVPRDYLDHVVESLVGSVGMVTAVISGQHARGFGAHLERIFLATFYSRWMVLMSSVGIPCVVGKSMAFRKKDAERFGGLKTLRHYIAEDYMAGQAVSQLGMQVAVMDPPVDQVIGRKSFGTYWARHLRWGRIRRAQAPSALAAEFFMSFWCACAGWCMLAHRLALPTLPTAVTFAALTCFCDMLCIRRVNGSVRWFDPAFWFVRETSHLFLWAHIIVGHRVEWRGQRYRLRDGGLLEALESRTDATIEPARQTAMNSSVQ